MLTVHTRCPSSNLETCDQCVVLWEVVYRYFFVIPRTLHSVTSIRYALQSYLSDITVSRVFPPGRPVLSIAALRVMDRTRLHQPRLVAALA